MAIALLATACASSQTVPSSPWISIEQVQKIDDQLKVTFTLHNPSTREFRYRGYSPGTTVPDQQYFHILGWRYSGFVCYTGMDTFAISPGGKQTFTRLLWARGRTRIGIQDEAGAMVWSPGFKVPRA